MLSYQYGAKFYHLAIKVNFMKHIFEYQGKKSVIESGGTKIDLQPGVHYWFGAPNEATLPLYVRSIRADKWECNAYIKRINSCEFSLEFPQTGLFSFIQKNHVYKVNPNEIIIMRKQHNNQLKCLSEKGEKWALLLGGTLLEAIVKNLRLDETDVIPLLNPEAVKIIFEKIFELSKNKTQENYLTINAECYKLLLELSNQTGALNQPLDIREALQYINQNLFSNITLADLCKHSGCSSATLSRKFNSYFKKSPIEYFLEKKLEKAKELLTQHVYSVKEVSSLLNYSSPQYFSSLFLKHFGESPSSVRKRKV